MDSVKPILALLGSGIATYCTHTGNVGLLATGIHPALDEEVTLAPFDSTNFQSSNLFGQTKLKLIDERDILASRALLGGRGPVVVVSTPLNQIQ